MQETNKDSYAYIKIESEILNFEAIFHRRLSFIKGDSGTGKTSIVYALETQNMPGFKVESNYEIVTVNGGSYKAVMELYKDTIIIIDDDSLVETGTFSGLYKRYTAKNNNFIIVFARGEDNVDNRLDTSRLAYSTNSVFEIVSKGNIYKLKNLYKDYSSIKNDTRHSIEIDCILTEDSVSGFMFFKELASDKIHVEHSTSGKSTIVDDLLRLTDDYEKILVIIDTAAFGCNMEELYSKCRAKLRDRVYYMSDYECFEELLISTNLLNKLDLVKEELKNVGTHANKYLSWERYFEDLVKRATNKKMYKHTHTTKIKDCYIKDCMNCCSKHKRLKCDGFIDIDKFEGLLKGTKYGRLLTLRDGNKNGGKP